MNGPPTRKSAGLKAIRWPKQRSGAEVRRMSMKARTRLAMRLHKCWAEHYRREAEWDLAWADYYRRLLKGERP